MFGPPQGFTPASTCSWLGHQVSGLRHDTSHPFQIRFRFGSAPLTLNLASHRNSPARSTKSTTSHAYGALSACRLTVSGSFSLPSRGSFHLSLTVLFAIGHMVVFSLTGWSPCLPSGFLVSRRTPVPLRFSTISPTGISPSSLCFSKTLRLSCQILLMRSLPRWYYYLRFGLLRFRSPLLSESFLLSFPPGTKMFQFPGFPPLSLCVQDRVTRRYSR